MSKDTSGAPPARSLVAPVEISRMLLLAFVAAGAVVSVTTSGQISTFAGGFAVGAGAAFVISRMRRPPDSAGEDGGGEAP
ncbi:MAG TPA: hypothetical protein VKH43_14890 [Thermoanaerobaculia bacterium]|nr:hypothetical protein [Thermoanaerobaculia bacterium]